MSILDNLRKPFQSAWQALADEWHVRFSRGTARTVMEDALACQLEVEHLRVAVEFLSEGFWAVPPDSVQARHVGLRRVQDAIRAARKAMRLAELAQVESSSDHIRALGDETRALRRDVREAAQEASALLHIAEQQAAAMPPAVQHDAGGAP